MAAAPENQSSVKLLMGGPILHNSHTLLQASLRFSVEPMLHLDTSFDLKDCFILHWNCRQDYIPEIVALLNSPAPEEGGSLTHIFLTKLREQGISIIAHGDNKGLWLIFRSAEATAQFKQVIEKNKMFFDRMVQENAYLFARLQSNNSPLTIYDSFKHGDLKSLTSSFSLSANITTSLLYEYLVLATFGVANPFSYVLSRLKSANLQLDLTERFPEVLAKIVEAGTIPYIQQLLAIQDSLIDKYGQFLGDQLQIIIYSEGTFYLQANTQVRTWELIKWISKFVSLFGDD